MEDKYVCMYQLCMSQILMMIAMMIIIKVSKTENICGRRPLPPIISHSFPLSNWALSSIGSSKLPVEVEVEVEVEVLLLSYWEGPITSCSRAIFRGGRNLHLLSRPILSAGAQQISWISFTSFAILFISGLRSIRIRKLMGRLFASYRVVAGVLNFTHHNNVSLPCSARAM